MPTIDKRVVDMQFNNAQFEKGIATTQKSLEKFNNALKFKDASKGFNDVNKAAGKVDMSKLASSLEMISNRFSTLGIVGVTVLQNLTNKAVDAGFKIASALTSAITAGGKSRALNLEAAEFQITGLLGEGAWDKIQEDINYGVKDTAYGLDAAAKVASQLAASQVQIGDNMKTALRSISGVAAMTNSTYDDIGSIYTTVAGNGRLMSEQLLQLSSRGLNAAATLGKALGKSEAEIRDMVSKGQIDFQTFAKAMDDAFGEHAKDANKTFEGALSNMKASLARFGAAFYTPGLENMRDIFNALTPAFDSAKKALTPLIDEFNRLFGYTSRKFIEFVNGINLEEAFSGNVDKLAKNIDRIFFGLVSVLSNLKGAIGQFIAPIKKVFSSVFPPIEITQTAIIGLTDRINGFIDKIKINVIVAGQLQKIFLGVFTVIKQGISVVQAIGGAFSSFLSGLAPLGSYLLSIAASMGKFLSNQTFLIDLANTITEITPKLKANEETISRLKRIFDGFFAVIQIGVTIIKAFGGALKSVLGKIAPLGPPLLEIAATIGDFLVKINNSIKGSTKISDIFRGIGDVIGTIASHIADSLGLVSKSFSSLVHGSTEGAFDLGERISTLLGKILTSIKDFVVSFAESFNLKNVFDTLNAALSGGFLVMLIKFFKEFKTVITKFNGDKSIFDSLKTTLENVQSSLSELQNSLKAYRLLTIAAAIGILAFSLVQLSKVDAAGLARGLTGLSGIIGELVGALYILSAIELPKGGIGISKIAGLLFALAVSVNILAKAVVKLSALDLASLAKGLSGVGILLAELTLAMKFADFGKIKAGSMVGLIALAAALNIMSSVVTKLSGLDLGGLAKGLGSIAVLLGAVAGFTHLVGNPKGLISTGIGLIAIATAINILARGIAFLGGLSIAELAKGLGAMGASLLIIGGSLRAVPKDIVSKGAGLIFVALAISSLSKSMKVLGGMSLGDIAKSLIALGGSLVIIAGAMRLMQTAIKGALALNIVAGSLMLLTPVLVTLGSMSLGSIATSLLALAGTFAVLGIAATVLQPVIPAMIGLSAAVALLGVGLLAAGTGILALSIGLTGLAAAGGAAITAITAIVGGLANLIPLVLTKIGEGIIALLEVISNSGSTIMNTIKTLISSVLTAIQETAPQLGETIITIINTIANVIVTTAPTIGNAISVLIQEFLNVVNTNIPLIIDTGMNLIMAFLQSIANNAYSMGAMGVAIITNFLNGVASQIGAVIDAAINLAISFINGLADGITNNREAFKSAIVNLIGSIGGFIGSCIQDLINAGGNIIDGLVQGIMSFGSRIGDAITGFVNGAVDNVKNLLGIHSPSRVFREIGEYCILGMVNGIEAMGDYSRKVAKNVRDKTVEVFSNAASLITDAMDTSYDFDPTIKPVVDMTNVDTAMSNMQTMFDTQRGFNIEPTIRLSKSALYRENQNGNEIGSTQNSPTVVNNYDMTQNNYSPKALSQFEIFRQTKNQFSRLKGVVNQNA